jgi:hypothetical protein
MISIRLREQTKLPASHAQRQNRADLSELADDNRNYKQNQDGNYRNRYNPICSHPVPRISVCAQ